MSILKKNFFFIFSWKFYFTLPAKRLVTRPYKEVFLAYFVFVGDETTDSQPITHCLLDYGYHDYVQAKI